MSTEQQQIENLQAELAALREAGQPSHHAYGVSREDLDGLRKQVERLSQLVGTNLDNLEQRLVKSTEARTKALVQEAVAQAQKHTIAAVLDAVTDEDAKIVRDTQAALDRTRRKNEADLNEIKSASFANANAAKSVLIATTKLFLKG